MISSSESTDGKRGIYYIDKEKFLSPSADWKCVVSELAKEDSQVRQDFENRFPIFYMNGNNPIMPELTPEQPIIPSKQLLTSVVNKTQGLIEQGLLFDHVGLREEEWDDNQL